MKKAKPNANVSSLQKLIMFSKEFQNKLCWGSMALMKENFMLRQVLSLNQITLYLVG
jgi:hypothetical protein